MPSKQYPSIKSLNVAQFGGIGERIVSQYYKGLNKNVSFVHKDFVDLIVDDKLIDVKAKRRLNEKFNPNKKYPYKGKKDRPNEVMYIHIIFFEDSIILHDDTRLLKKYSWNEIHHIFPLLEYYKKIVKIPGRQNSWKNIKNDISIWYRENTGQEIYCFYRGPANKNSWGSQPPDNSYPTPARLKRYSSQLFVQFYVGSNQEEDVEYLIAFPMEHLSQLPLGLLSGRQKRKGIELVLDIRNIYADQKTYGVYNFTSIENFKKNYFRRFSISVDK